MSTAGLLLAAGAGRRRGQPKALAQDRDGTSWLVRSLLALRDGGCAPVVVVLGAEHERARPLVPAWAEVVVATDWAEGQAASLRAGLTALTAMAALADGSDHVDSVLVSLVDLPDVGAPVVARITRAAAMGPSVELARATYGGVPGHPVLLGRGHWAAISAQVNGDRGARHYLAAHHVLGVECSDLATGLDVDGPPAAQSPGAG